MLVGGESIVAFCDYDYPPNDPVYAMGPLAGAKRLQRETMVEIRRRFAAPTARLCYPAMATTALGAIPGGLLMYAVTAQILKEQDAKSKTHDSNMIANLHVVKEIGREIKEALERGDLNQFGELMNTHWEYKKGRSASMSNDRIDHWYQVARNHGALGGKLIGAGGGGFLMFLCQEGARVRQVMAEEGLEEVRFRFDFQGATVVTQS